MFQVEPMQIGCQDPSNPIEVGKLLEMILSNRKLMFNATILSHLLAGLELVIPEMECQKTFRTAAMEFRSNFTEENVLDSIETLQNINNGADEWQVLSKRIKRQYFVLIEDREGVRLHPYKYHSLANSSDF